MGMGVEVKGLSMASMDTPKSVHVARLTVEIPRERKCYDARQSRKNDLVSVHGERAGLLRRWLTSWMAALAVAIEGMLGEDFTGRILPFDSAAAVAFAEIAANRRQAGRPIAQADAQIAAIARSRGAALATRNVPDFEGCGIELVNPWTEAGFN